MTKEFHANADLVMPFFDSGNSAATGFAPASTIPLETGVIRDYYILKRKINY